MGKSETTDGSSGVRQRIAPLVTVERGIRQLSDADTVQDYEYEFLRGSVRLRYVNPSPPRLVRLYGGGRTKFKPE